MTRGTTRGVSKRIPITEPDLGIRVSAARGLLQHLLRTDRLDALEGYSLNLNYPSVVGTMEVGGRETPYGFSSGIYVRHAAAATPVDILPPQEEIDALISEHAERWRLERMSTVDRNILRLAIYELLDGETPKKVIINEALEVAKKFSTPEAVHFINGILDAVRQRIEATKEVG